MNSDELKKRTKSFAIRVYKMAEKLPKSIGSKVITYQIIKSSSSVAANYRAACRAKSKPDFINKLKIVEEESDETLFWLEFIAELELIKPNLLTHLLKEADELVSIFTASINTTKDNLQKNKSKI
ncbi:MAG: four helix bundle protein [Bacteroidota bacterium]